MTQTSYVTEAQVKAVPTPSPTETWHPVAHSDIITTMERAAAHHGIEVVDRTYSMSANGARMFGAWELDAGDGNIRYKAGFRHAHDMSIAVSMCAGLHIIVCSNMIFSGDFLAFGKHTSGMGDDRLIDMANATMGKIIPEMDKMLTWQQDLNKIYVPRDDYKGLVYDMVTKGVFSGGQIQNYLTALDEEKALVRGYALDGATSLYNVHGAATRLMRGWNLLRVADATRKLNGLCDDYIEMRQVA